MYSTQVHSDGSGLGLSPKPARPRHFWAARACPKPDLQSPKARRAFSGLKSANFLPISGWIWVKFLPKCFEIFFWTEIGQKLADFWPISSRICGLVESWKNLTRKTSYFIDIKQNIGTFYTLEKPEKSPKPDTKKPGPLEARYIKARARPKPEKSRPGPSLPPCSKLEKIL